jgi:eukaryotic-like serine/threonine-protein kinase
MNDAGQREEAVFEAALQLSIGQRSAYLDKECAGDAELRRRVEALLGAFERAGGFMKQSADPTLVIPFRAPPAEKPGDCIGRYKLLEQIGEGGCGVVYVAEQQEPVRRRVAVKVIKLGMDTRQVIARFNAERQALAMMDHPNIAKVLDAGATDNGRPYFVMELVRGLKITDFCGQNELSTADRLNLCVQVCQAIQHAHQKGVIHRDIKPANILVTVNDGAPIPKVIDFGIAKATQGRLTDQTIYTAFEQFIGTPAYMSPEQAVMTSQDIDTRSDIYSLGVLLYELLTGKTPFDAKELLAAGLDQMRRTICEVEPIKPSKVVERESKLRVERTPKEAVQRGPTFNPRLKLLSTDLDWIVMKCLEKNRTRRYETANELAMDIKRHLNLEPVVARPPSKFYEFQKTVRRHRFGFTVAAAIILMLGAGIALTIWQAARARREATRATAALDELRQTAPAFAAQARSLATMERFDEAIEKLDYAIKLRPDEPEYLMTKGDLLQCQLKLAEATAVYREALRVRPGLARAEASAKLCEELLAAPLTESGKLTRESLAKLHVVMQKQQRPAAELMPVARLLGEEKKLLLDYWLARLKDLPISVAKPLKDRLTVRDDSRLALDLSDTKVTDLSPLAGAPLAVLNLSSSKEQSDLIDLSPLRGLDLVELNISRTSVADLTPLHEMHGLKQLNVAETKVTGLSPLNDLQLEGLNLTGTRTFDIAALRGMKLKRLSLRDTRVADLSPLAGMPLTFFDATAIPAADYSPLTGAPLEKCYIQNSPVRDSSFLRDSPVKELVLFNCSELRGYSVLAGLKSLDLLILPQSFRSLPDEDMAAIGALRSHPTLRNIQTEYRTGGGWVINTTEPKETFWQVWDREQAMIAALRKSGFKFTLTPLPEGTYSLTVKDQPLSDLSFLKGAPIRELNLDRTAVSDLTPLADLPLEALSIDETPVSDLGPLGGPGHRLREIYFAKTRVRNISALAGLPLKQIFFDNVEVSDVTPLLLCPTLEQIIIPKAARNVAVLKTLPRLTRISYTYDPTVPGPSMTAASFWSNDPGHGFTPK